MLWRGVNTLPSGNTPSSAGLSCSPIPACDLIVAGAEQWAARVRWSPPPSDA
jgi:hypothetical protein